MALPLCLSAFGFVFLQDYFAGAVTPLLTGAAAVAATLQKGPSTKPSRFAIVAALFLLLAWAVPVKTLLWASLAFAGFFLVEAAGFRIHLLGTVALLLSSPAFQYAVNAFSFPIRLQLAKAVGAVFSLFAPDTVLKGNTIFYGGREFAVDPVCMGLHMLSLSVLSGILLLGLLQRKAGRVVGWKASLLYLLCLLALNLFANVLRIVLLVQFAVPPGAVMHDAVGLACLLLYVCLPACYLAKVFVLRAPVQRPVLQQRTMLAQLPHWALLAGLLVVAQRVENVDTYAAFANKYNQAVAGYASSVYAPGILKLESEKALVYVKFIRGFYDTDHNPSVCWKGSGYDFKRVRTQSVAGGEMYTAQLCRANEKLYTAWWYGNGTTATTSHWEWRSRMLKEGGSFAVVNVTAESEAAMMAEVTRLVNSRILQPLFKQ